ncbi:N-acetylneuraminate synthase family protein [uncultured Polaribacter sp.]|uniref:N-acetylneuraminate synthase family protein n=1 Tax=uncultured Polaribacter sp. TaxID=174711 RepID=UPI0026124941|nr:N-acetylneuraminate synthase family protein [uncultured Polaribacter sp.]
MNSPFIIAEIAQAHDGSIGILHSYIDALSKTGVDAIKFQTHIAAAESSIYEPFRVQFSKQDKTRFDYWKRMEFSLEQWKNIKQHCDDVGLEFMSSPFSNKAVDLLEKVGIKRYKIGSGEITNLLLLEKIAKTGKPVIISSGMSSLDELDSTTKFLKEKKINYAILQCTTAYPTKPTQYGLNVINELKERYDVKVGYSDHSSSIGACIAATVLGAEILEFHVVFDKEMFGPDAKASLTIKETKKLVKEVRKIAIANANPINKNNNTSFNKLKTIFEKSLCVNKDLPKNHIINFNDLEAKKPSNRGIPANDFNAVIGKKISHAMNKWDFLNESDLI